MASGNAKPASVAKVAVDCYDVSFHIFVFFNV